jgi:hypothetical protein
MCLLASWV